MQARDAGLERELTATGQRDRREVESLVDLGEVPRATIGVLERDEVTVRVYSAAGAGIRQEQE